MEPNSAELLVERNLSKQDDILKWRTDRRLRTISSVRLTHPQAEFFMRNLTMPVMVIHGTKGFDQVRGFVESRKEWVKDLVIENCPGGHHLHMDEPQPVGEVIYEFLKSSLG